MKKLSVLMAGLFCSIIIGFSQEASETITRDFFVNFAKDPATAYSTLFAGNTWISAEAMETNKADFTAFLKDIGNYCGYELILTKKVGESYMLKSFIVKYERQPIRFTFLLYKPTDKWVIQNFSWDAGLEDELYSSSSLDK
jgi:hypothetical protein